MSVMCLFRTLRQCMPALAFTCLPFFGSAQIVQAFDIRYQAQQNGGIQFLANTTMYCGTGSPCTAAQQAMPITGWPQENNNAHNMQYYDGDADPDTWCASSDSLALGTCAEISFAGLYWAGRLGNGFVPNENLKDQVKIRADDGDPYIDITADEVDKATAALITDLKRRGMLDDTLVLWGGEFGRTPMGQGSGRDHHIRGFSYFLAGGGVKGGVSHGATDELGYHAVEDVVHVRDLHATILHLLGIDHDRLSVPFQGLDVRLTGVEPARPIRAILA